MEAKVKAASIMKYKGIRDDVIIWMSHLPRIPKPYEVKVTFDELRRNNYLLWTEEGGIRILK